jgi:hypothetical protein
MDLSTLMQVHGSNQLACNLQHMLPQFYANTHSVQPVQRLPGDMPLLRKLHVEPFRPNSEKYPTPEPEDVGRSLPTWRPIFNKSPPRSAHLVGVEVSQ